jgi:hypothetical protein
MVACISETAITSDDDKSPFILAIWIARPAIWRDWSGLNPPLLS